MVEFLVLLKWILGLGTLLILALLIMLSLPQSQLPKVCGQASKWLLAALCAIYALSPVDILPEAILGPFGIFDDLAAVVIGVKAGISAWQARRQPSADK
jgi:uncharacterized membrane protein YkvA (DUF1232 family)